MNSPTTVYLFRILFYWSTENSTFDCTVLYFNNTDYWSNIGYELASHWHEHKCQLNFYGFNPLKSMTMFNFSRIPTMDISAF